jgi:two-component system, sensor histidine kinase and response regulator
MATVLPHAAAAERLRRAHAGRSVLLAEDHPIQSAIAEELLRHVGLAVRTVGDGQAALQAAREGGHDLVLMDVQMPGVDGLAAARLLRAAGFTAPIVALTGNTRPQDRAECLAAGMNDVLAKPVEPRLLYETLLAWLPVPDPARDGELMARLQGVDGLDPQVALANVGGDVQVLERVLARFMASYRDGAPELAPQAAAEARRRAVHALRGVAGTLGAITLLGTLEACEAAGAEVPDTLAQAAQAELRALVDALQGALAPR